MKIGSIVAIKPLPGINERLTSHIKWVPTCDGRTPYVLRDMEVDKSDGEEVYRFEEGIIGYNPYNKKELGIGRRYLIELLPPEEQINVQELVNVEELTA